VIGGPGAKDIAQEHADAEHGEDPRHDLHPHAGHRLQRRGQIGVDREHAAEADRADAERQPHLPALQGAELTPGAGVRMGGIARREQGDQGHGDSRQHPDDSEGPAPSVFMADDVDDGHAQNGADGQAHQDGGDRASAEMQRHDRGRDQSGDAEIGPVRQAAQKPEHQHPAIGRRQGAEHIADREQGHEADQQQPARQTRAEHGQDRSPDHDAGGVGADDVAGGRRIDAQAGREVRQDAHGRELGHADGETAHGQGQKNKGDRAA
jgi:hypothetical protein